MQLDGKLMSAPVRILLVDDHLVVREGLKRLIELAGGMEVVGEADNGREGVDRVSSVEPDIVIMDVSMPELDGIQATRRIRRLRPATKVLALTVFEDKERLRALLDAGAAGYVLKRSAGDELIHAIRAVSSGGMYLDPRIAEKAVSDKAPPQDALAGELSQREAAVLRLIAEGYSNKEIGATLEVSVKTVETYKARSMKKLRLRSRVDIVRFANRAGWLTAEP
jgi:DNA-binding NarL/FixJ family response regulator